MTTKTEDSLRHLLNEAAMFGMLRRIYQSDPSMTEGTRTLMRTVFASQRDKEKGIRRQTGRYGLDNAGE